MECPKCGFESAADGSGVAPDSCARCGVVFAKLASRGEQRRPPRSESSPVARAPVEAEHQKKASPSLGNILFLSALLSLSVFFFWRSQRQAEEEPTRRPPTSVPLATPVREPTPAPAAESSDSEKAAVHDLAIDMSRLRPDAPPATAPAAPAAASESDADVPDLPELTQATVNRVLLDRAVEASRKFPGEVWLRQYVAQAHLLLAAKETRGRQFAEALRDIDEAERWGSDSGQVAANRALVYGEQQSWELAEKWARTALAYGARDNAAEMHHLIGKAFYFREQMDKAIEEFRIALSLEDSEEIRKSLDRALREARASSGFDQKRLSHFIVTYEGNTMESAGRLVLDSMERSYASLVSQLGFAPTEPVVVILYSQRSYHEMGGPHWSAGLFDGKIRVPVQGLEQVDEQIRATLHHELAHAFIHARAGDGVPRWLHEGLAEYLEGSRTAPYGKPLAKLLNDGKSLEMCISAAACDVRLFYPAATSLVEYMIDNRGMGGIRDLLSALGEGNDIDQSLRKVMGRDQSQLIGDWEHFVKRRFG